LWWEWLSTISNRVNGNGCPHCNKRTVSEISQKWLDSFGITEREVKLPRFSRIRVDGFDPDTNTVYEFLGDYWHGNPEVFSSQDFFSRAKKKHFKTSSIKPFSVLKS